LLVLLNRPVVTIDSKKDTINFGRIPVLTRVDKKLKLINESLIPAPYRVLMPKRQAFFADVESGVIPPGQSLSVNISVTMEI
jgi:hypothetical protein